MSSLSPTHDSRTMSGGTPALIWSSSLNCRWVASRWITSDFASPMLARCGMNCSDSMNFYAGVEARPRATLMPKDSNAPAPLACSASPTRGRRWTPVGIFHPGDLRMVLEKLCHCHRVGAVALLRTGSVSTPCSNCQALNGDRLGPNTRMDHARFHRCSRSCRRSRKTAPRDTRPKVRSSWENCRCPRKCAFSITTPPMVVPCPPMNLVARVHDDVGAVHQRPAQMGRRRGVIDDEGTPASFAIAPTAQIDHVDRQLPAFRKDRLGVGADAFRKFSGSSGSTRVASIPNFLKFTLNIVWVPPYSFPEDDTR